MMGSWALNPPESPSMQTRLRLDPRPRTLSNLTSEEPSRIGAPYPPEVSRLGTWNQALVPQSILQDLMPEAAEPAAQDVLTDKVSDGYRA